MILCDLPYGVTQNKWDSVIPFELLWAQYERIIKPNGAIVLFGSEPFTSKLICSNPKLFRYTLVWDKKLVSGFLNANRQPLRAHEDIVVFYKKQPTYNPQMVDCKKVVKTPTAKSSNYGDYRVWERRCYEKNTLVLSLAFHK